MKRCKYCNAEVDTEKTFCPLCFNHLEGSAESAEGLYTLREKNETSARTSLFLVKLFLFLSFVTVVVCTVVNILTEPKIGWFWVVIWGIVYLWVLIAHTILSKRSAFRKVFLQVLTIVVLLYFAEKLSLRSWLFSYVYPGIGLAVITVLAMVSFISEKRGELCLGFAITILLLGAGSIAILIFNAASFKLLNVINVISSFVALIGYILFGFGAMKNEFAKKWHL